MLAHTAQALTHTLILLLAISSAVGHGVYLSALLDLVEPGPSAIISGALIGWLVALILYLISAMLAPKNSRFIRTLTDVILLLVFAAIGAGGTAYLAIMHWTHLDVCHRRIGQACEASLAGGVIGAVVVVALVASAITEAVYVSKHHGREGWFLSLRCLGQDTANVEALRPLVLPLQMPRKARQGAFVPIIVTASRRSKEYEDLALVSPGAPPLRVMNRSSSDTLRSFHSGRSAQSTKPRSTTGRRRSGSASSITSMFSKKRTPSVFSQASSSRNSEEAAPLVGNVGDDPFARSPRPMSDRVEELDDKASLRSVRVNPQTRKRGGVALNAWPWRPESTVSNVEAGTAV
ncbi:hypothetical protein CcaverHIS002_0400840 [Cutaneotrichosporon cavernicola]|uniref:MARVEL domain-containing protein n=1 Tax=Cutaneotrichosporon cavernicola TaxID=279322 RepID=A0AA48QVE3_9TREE|nr:uncharacterized protein CcaverHIS019_0400800 [Cutaneotrichosporon cavernicola]BEI83480.1 hypothetical protein CcaverHIS002_0400840 [Cutaneotrichosporon cavernicola]BEI91260.1 hypothetical protein CcaverHIS019_0400800 [Cutaneotrichosporon cavernicola]BEI99033.1 hypothetical protein CcaverHIS631_0400760 [Cutaneotrichosporon cavernicola]BEJ06807.1 hypothetical protein CcaverHIS641_0400760 [Cutaneotrichosporon cavernicola]